MRCYRRLADDLQFAGRQNAFALEMLKQAGTQHAGISLTLSAVFCILPWLPGWQWVALVMFLVGLCISLRVVAMSTVFLVRLPELGQGKAGWYKGTLTLGMQFLGRNYSEPTLIKLASGYEAATAHRKAPASTPARPGETITY